MDFVAKLVEARQRHADLLSEVQTLRESVAIAEKSQMPLLAGTQRVKLKRWEKALGLAAGLVSELEKASGALPLKGGGR
jgi:hypothetical protein